MSAPAQIVVEGPAAAPVLVLANSLGSDITVWDEQMPALTARFRVVRYEYPGHGGTIAPAGRYGIEDLGSDLLGVLDAVAAERVSVMGLSLGGTVALWLAARHPERVDRLVVAASAAHWPPAEAWEQRIAAMETGIPSDLMGVLLGRWFTPAWLAGHPEAADRVAAMLSGASPAGYAGCCAALAAVDLRPDLAAISAPTLILGGIDDPACPLAGLSAMAAAIPGAELRVLPGSHLINIEQPARFTAAVMEHLAGDGLTRGREVRRAVLGADHVDRSPDDPFVELITRYAWGEIWTRPGLDRRTRSAITVAMLVARGRYDELELHLRGALNNGLSAEEITEILLQTAIYCGVPAANSAFAVARRVLGAQNPSVAGNPT